MLHTISLRYTYLLNAVLAATRDYEKFVKLQTQKKLPLLVEFL